MLSVGGRFSNSRSVSGYAAVESYSAKKRQKFNGFQEAMPTDDGWGRQFVSQLGALAVRERLPTNSLSIILLILNVYFFMPFRTNAA